MQSNKKSKKGDFVFVTGNNDPTLVFTLPLAHGVTDCQALQPPAFKNRRLLSESMRDVATAHLQDVYPAPPIMLDSLDLDQYP